MECLLIDRALGQLEPEVEELVEIQIANDPEIRRCAAELEETVRLTSEVMKARVPANIHRLPIAAMRRRETRKRVLAIAASFLLGAGCALWAGHLFATSARPSRVVSWQAAPRHDEPAPPSPAVEQAVRKLPFWSYARIYTVASATRQGTSTHPTK
jgi:hypothetical protein